MENLRIPEVAEVEDHSTPIELIYANKETYSNYLVPKKLKKIFQSPPPPLKIEAHNVKLFLSNMVERAQSAAFQFFSSTVMTLRILIRKKDAAKEKGRNH